MNEDLEPQPGVVSGPARNARLRELAARAQQLKRDRDAILLVHLYQRPEIQDIGDLVGDSLGLAQAAAKTEHPVIVFCGVHFMAESAYILSPSKTVVLPEPQAGCPMADMVTPDGLRRLKALHPGVPVVCYVNSSAAVKAESDICCTSRNAVKIAQSLPGDSFIFVPDRNLGSYVAARTGKTCIAWEGHCPTHDRITAPDVRLLQRRHPGAVTMVHPECRPEVVALADEVFSTQGMIDFARKSSAGVFIVGTEIGILHQLKKDSPMKTFLFPSEQAQICPNMKATTLKKVVSALETLQPRVTVPEEIRQRAVRALDRMISIE
jgi:quinolinate synthase